MRFHLDIRGYPAYDTVEWPVMSLKKVLVGRRGSADSDDTLAFIFGPVLVGHSQFKLDQLGDCHLIRPRVEI